uniref:Uncharacterized protein n=1 Tax=Arcella intermedia TaxID=1963864 RepID=A0A6B2LY71_9EUKA
MMERHLHQEVMIIQLNFGVFKL